MKTFLFGYGSIINLESAEKTIGRTVKEDDVLLVTAKDFLRTWRVVIPVVLNDDQDETVDAIFLDLEHHKGGTVNGIAIEVSPYECDKLDIREQYYKRIDITECVAPPVPDGRVFTYQGRPEFFVKPAREPKILGLYLDIVYRGVRHWGKEFVDAFEESTQPCIYEVIEGAYKFLDDELNVLTGHD